VPSLLPTPRLALHGCSGSLYASAGVTTQATGLSNIPAFMTL